MWSVDSQDWRITAGGQTEAGLLANVTQWVNNIPTSQRGGNSLMHDLNNVTVGADLKALPLLHAKTHLVPVGVCAGWTNASYLEQLQATHPSGGVVPAASQSGSAPHSSSGAGVIRPFMYTAVLVSFTAFISYF